MCLVGGSRGGQDLHLTWFWVEVLCLSLSDRSVADCVLDGGSVSESK